MTTGTTMIQNYQSSSQTCVC